MLIIQHIWMKWTKLSRGADAAIRRPRLDEAYSLPALDESHHVLRHEIRALESDGFRVIEEAAGTDRMDWPRLQPYRDNALDWRERGDAVEIILTDPSQHRRQTKWPAHLPSPLFTLREGETARVDWNGRFRTSMGGSNRSSYYEQHIYWLAVAARPVPSLFLDAKPRKHIDLRTEIY